MERGQCLIRESNHQAARSSCVETKLTSNSPSWNRTIIIIKSEVFVIGWLSCPINMGHLHKKKCRTLSRKEAFLGPRPHTNCSSATVCGCSSSRFGSTPTSLTTVTNSWWRHLTSCSLATWSYKNKSCHLEKGNAWSNKDHRFFISLLLTFL